MSLTACSHYGEYALATGPDAVGRLNLLHQIYAPAGRDVLLHAGLTPGMRVADFGCGIGATTRTLAYMVGPHGRVVGVDSSAAQLEQARHMCSREGVTNTKFIEADACSTGLPRGAFDLVYCRLLLLHLTQPEVCLNEMREILKPGGILVVEDGDLASAASVPSTALDAFPNLFCRLGASRGVDYSIANRLGHLISSAGFLAMGWRVHQPADRGGAIGLLLKWSVQEAGPAFVDAGLISASELERTLWLMQRAADDPSVMAIAPRMSLVWARKALD